MYAQGDEEFDGEDLPLSSGVTRLGGKQQRKYKNKKPLDAKRILMILCFSLCCIVCCLLLGFLIAGVIVVSTGHNFCKLQYVFNGGNVEFLYNQFVSAAQSDASYNLNLNASVPLQTLICTHTTATMKFVDDLDLRFTLNGTVTIVDAYSKSRIGKVDFGQNYRNIANLVSLTQEADYTVTTVAGC